MTCHDIFPHDIHIAIAIYGMKNLNIGAYWHIWFLEIDFVHDMCMCVYVCVCVCARVRVCVPTPNANNN